LTGKQVFPLNQTLLLNIMANHPPGAKMIQVSENIIKDI